MKSSGPRTGPDADQENLKTRGPTRTARSVDPCSWLRIKNCKKIDSMLVKTKLIKDPLGDTIKLRRHYAEFL